MDNFLTGRPENIAHLLSHPRFQFIQYDVTNYIHVDGPLDFILHLASPAEPGPTLSGWASTSSKSGRWARTRPWGLAVAKQAKFLLASTSEVYGDPLVHPQSEEYLGNVNPIGIRGVYDEAKRFAEAMAMAYHRQHGTDVRIVRIFNTYGERMRQDDGRAVPNFINQALKGDDLTVYGDGQQTRSICYCSDLIAGLYKLMRSEVVTPVNLGNPCEITILDLARKIIAMDRGKSRIAFPRFTAGRPPGPPARYCQGPLPARLDAPRGAGRRAGPDNCMVRARIGEIAMCAFDLRENALGVEIHASNKLLALYRATEELPRSESPKPCFAPLYTLSGQLITEYRPPDHAWHTGLYFGWVHVNDANLWGGPWYLPEKKKYEYVADTHGVQRHDRFTTWGAASATESLSWLDGRDQLMALESRSFGFYHTASGYCLRVSTRIDPAGDRLVLGASRAAALLGVGIAHGAFLCRGRPLLQRGTPWPRRHHGAARPLGRGARETGAALSRSWTTRPTRATRSLGLPAQTCWARAC